jgi:hypothetical protein
MPLREVVPSMAVLVQALAPPVGLVEVSTLPELSTAAQNDEDAHAMSLITLELSMLALAQELPVAGVVDQAT